MEKKKQKRRGPGALDVFIVLALIAVIAGVALRAYITNSSEIGTAAVLEDYEVSFEVLNIRDSSNARHMHPGDKYYLKENGAFFGTLTEVNTVNPASAFYEMPDGSIVRESNSATGDNYKVDVQTSVIAQGLMSGNGSFLLGGNTYLGMNKEVQIISKYLSITVRITDIEKVN